MVNKLIRGVHEYVKTAVKDNPKYKGLYDGHLTCVLKHTLKLGKTYNLDLEILEIAAISHDIAKLKSIGDSDNHALNGAKHMRKWLEERDYPKNKIMLVFDCIKWHGGINTLEENDEFNKQNLLSQTYAKIIMSADGLAHIDLAPQLLILNYVKYQDMRKAFEETINKLDKERKYKIQLKEALDYSKDQHNNYIKSLELAKKYFPKI